MEMRGRLYVPTAPIYGFLTSRSATIALVPGLNTLTGEEISATFSR